VYVGVSAQCRARPRISIDDAAAAAAATAPKPNVVGWREQQRLGPAHKEQRRSPGPTHRGEQDEPRAADKGWALGAVGRTEAAHAEAAANDGDRRQRSVVAAVATILRHCATLYIARICTYDRSLIERSLSTPLITKLLNS